jgi:hypothetical protein
MEAGEHRARTRLITLLSVLGLVALCVLFFWQLVFTDMILARGDTYRYFYPYWDARDAALRAGQLPLWTPDIFMGVPLLANPQIGTFYPPNWLTIALPAPDAVRYAIILHIIWAGLGALVLFWATMSRAWLPALTTALLFALGGYVGGHIEQINQLQGIAWLPWLFYLYHRALSAERARLWLLFLGMGWALQIFSGHTQTVFMTGIGLGVYGIVQALGAGWRTYGRHLLKLAIATVIAIVLALPQLLPTLELTGMSNRGSGLNAREAVAFSLPPWYLPRSLLGIYDGQLFSEYVVTIGVIGLCLALIGALVYQRPADVRRYTWVVLTLVGVLLALGAYNPLYWLLANLPGFNLFRVPARWMALAALALAMLTGRGVLALQVGVVGRSVLALVGGGLLLVIALAGVLPIAQVDVSGALVAPLPTVVMWGVIACALVCLLWLAGQRDQVKPDRPSSPAITRRGNALALLVLIALIIELFAATRRLPYTDLVPRDVYTGQRFTISQLQALTASATPPPRTLSIGNQLFDTGDKVQLRARYEALGMDEEAIQIAFTAIKQQEMLAPNQALTWGIPTLDGYGGGVLPTIYYSQFISLLLPEATPRITDGRMGESLAREACRGVCVPPRWLLRLTDTRYLIADKLYDVWHAGIAYDTTFSAVLATDARFHNPSGFVADRVHVLYSGANAPTITYADAGTRPPLAGPVTLDNGLQLAAYDLTGVDAAATVRVIADVDRTSRLMLHAVTLVDTRTGEFRQLMPAGITRVLSSDVKAYDLGNAGRVRLVTDVTVLADDWESHEAALAHLRATGTTVLHGDVPTLPATDTSDADGAYQARITHYSPTRVEVAVTSPTDAYLYLADAYYPGWRATVNEADVPIHRADVLFRAVRVPAGTSQVVFSFVPTLWYGAIAGGALAWVLALLMIGWQWRRA